MIVGASIGGVSTAKALRSNGFAGEITVIGNEPHQPYDKPQLSKAALAGRSAPDASPLLDAASAAGAGITLRLGDPAVSVDSLGHTLTLEGGSRLNYDQLVIATGARARPSPWGTPDRVHVLRTLDDCLNLRDSLLHSSSLAIVGAGFIGAEVAATARSMGIDRITMIDPVPFPMSRVMNSEVATIFAEAYAAQDIHLRFGTGVTSIKPQGSQLAVVLTDGSTEIAGTVLVGIGAAPNDLWLTDSGLEVDNGVVCDQFSRCTGATDIFAVGDVSRWWSVRDGRTKRLEHWTNAVEQAACVAHNIINPDGMRTHDPIEYVWSDQFDWRIQMVGQTGSPDYHRTDSPSGPKSFAVAYADPAGRLTGALVVNWPRALAAARRSITFSESAATFTSAISAMPAPKDRTNATGE